MTSSRRPATPPPIFPSRKCVAKTSLPGTNRRIVKDRTGPDLDERPVSIQYVTEPGNCFGQLNPFLPARRRPTVGHSLVPGGARRHPLQACLPDGRQRQCLPSSCLLVLDVSSFFRVFRQLRGSTSPPFCPLRRTSRCPRTVNPRSASRRCHPSRVPIVAVSSSSLCFSSCRVGRANLATSACPGGRNISLRWRIGDWCSLRGLLVHPPSKRR